MGSYQQDLKTFMVVCDSLLGIDLNAVKLTNEEARLIQFYICALREKFPVPPK